MRRLLAAALAALAIGGVTVAAPAEAAAPSCVTKAEYRSIRVGDTEAEARRVLGRGKVVAESDFDGYRNVTRNYRTCAPYRYGYVTVSFSAEPGAALAVDFKAAGWIK